LNPALKSFPQYPAENDYIYVKENKRAVKILFKEILYIESLKDYVIIHTETKNIISKIPISDLEEQLPTGRFLRIHRSFIVSVSKIDAFTSYSVDIGKKELTIGRTYKNSVLKELGFTKV
jgi:DNA-binding LytR/AlgR family response regulator